MWLQLVVFCVILRLQATWAFSSGAGTSACESITPSHPPHEPQISMAPIILTLSTQNLRQGETMTLTIEAQEDFAFRGFMIQARTLAENSQVVGRFLERDNMRTVSCLTLAEESVATHINAALKTRIEFTWQAETTFIGIINFHFTIVQNYATFWTAQQSQFILVSPGEVEDLPETTEEIPNDTTEQIPDDTTTTVSTTTESPVLGVYEGCGTRKLCFGFPLKCIKSRDCELFGAVIHDENDKFIFELLSVPGESYVAMALSDDAFMGRDSVIECVNENNNRVAAYTSFTSVEGGWFAIRNENNQNIIDLKESQIINGRIYCLVERDNFTVIDNMEFDLWNEKHYLLLASGIEMRPQINSIGQHTKRSYSDRAYLLTIPRIVRPDNTRRVLVSVHGALMIVAWIGLTSIGIIMSRYFKKTWTNQKICSLDAWFFWHVCCMILTWILTISSIVVIFVDLGQWRTSEHAILGIVTTILVFFQPIGAVLRPKPTSSKRPIFNFLHFAIGNIAHILALITIFYSVTLTASNIPYWTTYILVSFVVYYLLMHVIFMTIQVFGDIKKEQKVGSSKSQPFGLLRKTLFGFFVLTVVLFVIALVLIVSLPPF